MYKTDNLHFYLQVLKQMETLHYTEILANIRRFYQDDNKTFFYLLSHTATYLYSSIQDLPLLTSSYRNLPVQFNTRPSFTHFFIPQPTCTVQYKTFLYSLLHTATYLYSSIQPTCTVQYNLPVQFNVHVKSEKHKNNSFQ